MRRGSADQVTITLMRFTSLFLGMALAGSALVRAEARPAPAASRQAFLKLIDRPRVEPEVEENQMPAPPGMLQSHVVFSSQADQRVPVLLLKPDGIKPGTKLPVVIVLHGTGGKKEGNLGLMKTLAGKGFMAVAPDGRYHGERCAKGSGTADYYAAIAQAFKDGRSHPWLYDTVYDVMRLIDYLQTRPDVDPRRIALLGFSKGGMETYLAAAADQRIAVAIPCIGVQSYRYALENNQWKGRIGTVQGAADAAAKEAGVPTIDTDFVKRFYDRVVPGIYDSFDGPAMLPLIAPRPLLVINGDSDDKTPLPGVKLAAEAARAAYQKAGVPDHFVLNIQENTGHRVNPESTKQAVEWVEKWLK
jgi:dienelactone hydrolase